MRRLVPSVGGITAWLALAAGLPAVGLAQNYVKPGDAGTIEFPLENDAALSGGTIENVSVSVTVPPAYQGQFNVTGVSIKEDSTQPPTTFNLGDVKTLAIEYAIGPDAPDGSFTTVLTVNTPDQAVIFDPPPGSAEVAFTGGSRQASDGRAVLAVLQKPPFTFLKLSHSSPPAGEASSRGGPGAASPCEGEASTEGVEPHALPRRDSDGAGGCWDMAGPRIVRPGAFSLVVESRFIQDRRFPHPIASSVDERPAAAITTRPFSAAQDRGASAADARRAATAAVRGLASVAGGRPAQARRPFALARGVALRWPLLRAQHSHARAPHARQPSDQRFSLRAFSFNDNARAQRTGTLGCLSVLRPVLDAGRPAGPDARGVALAAVSGRSFGPGGRAPHARCPSGPQRRFLLRAFSFNDGVARSFAVSKEFFHSGLSVASTFPVVHRIHSGDDEFLSGSSLYA